ncbi:MAG: RNA methyltransferase [Burkholderiales bacterium]
MKKITSRDNTLYKTLHKLASSTRERKKLGLSLLDGVHLIEMYQTQYGAPKTLLLSESGEKHIEIAALIKKSGAAELILLPDAMFADISPVDTPLGILALIDTPKPQPARDVDFCVMLEAIQDPGNLGAILRSAAAAGVAHVFLSSHCAFPWSPKVIRAGMGAHFLLSIHEGADLMHIAQNFKGKVLAMRMAAKQSIYQTDLRGPIALLIGNEGAGLSAELQQAATTQVSIPMPGKMESLNAAAAAAICLFERLRQMKIEVV